MSLHAQSPPAEVLSSPAEVFSSPAEVRSSPVEVPSSPVEVPSSPVDERSLPVSTAARPGWSAADVGLSYDEFRRLLLFRLPSQFFTILAVLHRSPTSAAQHTATQFVEFFSGRGRLAAAARLRFGGQVATFDRRDGGESQDINRPLGFVHALRLALSLQPGALSWWGFECSNFVWLSRSKTRRSRAQPRGNGHNRNVFAANVMVSRVALLMCVLTARCCHWGLEQPDTSIALFHPALAWLRSVMAKEFAGSWFVRSYMCHFGHACLKGSFFVASSPFIVRLRRRRPPTRFVKDLAKVVRKHKLKSGNRSVSGGGAKLKRTQDYTREFSEALLDAWGCKDTVDPAMAEECRERLADIDYADDPWRDLCLEDVVGHLDLFA
jgi:hypothetical protein